MSRNARIGLVAGTIIVLFIALLVARPNDDDSSTTADTTPVVETTTVLTTTASTGTTETTVTTVTPKPKPKPKPVLLTGKDVKTISVKKGETVRFRARSATGDEIHVHGYDLSKEAPAGKTVSMSFKAKIDGKFEIEFENSGTEIAQLKVNP